MDDDEEGEAGEAGGALVHAPGVGQGRGEVDEARDHRPGRVDRPAVQNEPVDGAPPEQRPAALELVRVLVEVPGHEGDHQHVGDGDGGKEDRRNDDQVRVINGSVPDEDPAEIQDEVEGHREGHRWSEDVWAHIQPAS